MSIPNRQIGTASSTENTLLHNILKQLQRLTQVISTTGGGGGGSISDLTPATADNTISNEGYQQNWTDTKLNLNFTDETLSGKSIIFLGTSVSQGYGTTPSPYSSDKFTTKLALYLGLTEINYGTGGQRADQVVLSNIPTYNSATHKYLSVEYGINDLIFGTTSVTYSTYIDAIVANAQSKGWPAGSILLLSVPGSYYPNANITAYNAALSTLATINNQVYIDVTTAFNIYGLVSTYTTEFIHPNNSGHQLIANIVTSKVKPGIQLGTPSFANNGKTVFNDITYLNLPFLPKGRLIGIADDGQVGVIDAIPEGTRLDGGIILSPYNYFTGGLNQAITGPAFAVSSMNAAPATASSAGVLGEIRWTNGFVYLCVATNTWKRAALTTW